jgi:cytoskeletal protein CcmA (bactofilin family)
MPSPFRFLGLAALTGALLVGSAAPALAVETSTSEIVIIPADDVFEGDLYAATVRILVEGEIQGDLVVFAADEVVIRGVVTGSVFAMAPRVQVEGRVGGSLRVAGGSLTVTGEVDGDVVAAVGSLDLGETSRVAGDVLGWALRMSSLGRVEGILEGSQRVLRLGGEAAEIDVVANRVEVVAPLRVLGDLDYRSDEEIIGLERAQVDGVVVRKTPLPPNIRIRALRLVSRLLTILVLTAGTLAVAWAWPTRTRAAMETVSTSPWRAWWRGALVLASPLAVAGLAGLLLAAVPPLTALSLGLFVAPLVVAVIGVVLVLALLAGVPAVGSLGVRVFSKLDYFGAVAAGSLLAGVAWLLPWVGWLVPVVVLPLGLGAWMVSWRSEAAD